MSYKQAVLRDNPLSLWMLDGASTQRTYATILLEYATYQEYLDNESTYLQEVGSKNIIDSSGYGNHGAYTLGSPNFQDITSIISHSNYDTQYNGCRINTNVGIEALNLYNVFQQGQEHKTFGLEFWILMPGSINGQSNIMDLHSGPNTRMQIYANNDILYFTVYFQGGLSITTQKQIFSWDQPIHVFASIKDLSMSISVNGITDESVLIPSNYKFYSDSERTRFRIGPATASSYFIINGVAIYDRKLSINEIRNHMFWAAKDSDPTNYSNQTDVSHFSFDNTSGKTVFSKKFTSNSLYNSGTFSNLISDKTGLTLAQTTYSAPNVGTWIYPLSMVSYSNFSGIEVSWDTGAYDSIMSSKYVTVDVSYDGGTTFYSIKNGKAFPYFLSSYGSLFGASCLIRVTIASPDTSLKNQPRIDNLNIVVYSAINEISDSGLFEIYPASSTTYMMKKDTNNILGRSNNLGIKFAPQDPGSNPGYAIISKLTQSSYQSVEFWMRYEGTGSAVIETIPGYADLHIDSNNMLQNTIPGSTLYVNGINRNSSPITIIDGEVYHIIMVYPASSSNDILLNGSADISKVPSEASYGYITLYPNALTQSQVQNRYLSFISVVTSIANDNFVVSGNSITSIGSSISSIGQIMEYHGSSTQLNNGQAVLFYKNNQ
jgi:hypothetical protein